MIRYVPFLGQRYAPVRLGQPGQPVPVIPEKPISKTEAAIVMSTLTVFGAGTAWVGIETGLREQGVLKIVGWGIGIGGGLMGAIGLHCLIMLATGHWEPQLPAMPASQPSTK